MERDRSRGVFQMIPVEEWRSGLKAWQNIKKQSEIDGEQADLVIPVIEQKIRELETQEVKNGE